MLIILLQQIICRTLPYSIKLNYDNELCFFICSGKSWISSMIRAGITDAGSMNRNYESRLWISDLTTGDSIIVIFQKGMIIGGDSCSFYKTEKISNEHAKNFEICFSIYFWIQDAMLLPQPSLKGNSSTFYGLPSAERIWTRILPISRFWMID